MGPSAKHTSNGGTSGQSLRRLFLLLPLLSTILLLSSSTGPVSAYYTQHFYLPTGYFGKGLFDRPSALASSARSAPSFPAIRKPFYLNPTGDEPKMMIVEAEMEADESEQQPKPSREVRIPAMAAVKSAEQQPQAIPRRQMRHLLADEFSNGRMGRQYKRMRPCFYSPIQCLMRRRRSTGE